MRSYSAHIINHTHWDREWFLTSIYTSQWIPALIDRLEQLVQSNPNYHFLLDGQTLVIEDLLELAPQYEEKVNKLVREGHLIIGPYYCQPDWRMIAGELLIRNLYYGWQDMQSFGKINRTAWSVDTFGHISQSPQLHHLFDLDTVFIWRGVPRLEPYFNWQGADGQMLMTINLFGGYRNLYGISHVPEVALKRLESEVARLGSHYPTGDIPLFDGYDLEQNPEDPMDFYRQLDTATSPVVEIKESTPRDYVQELQDKIKTLPIITGELLSGKYGSVFPGTLSTRTYLKIMHRDCEQLLFQVCEPLAVLARFKGRKYQNQQYEEWGRLLLQNAIHDCICGVSIDQVHEKMEFSYRELFGKLSEDVQISLDYIMRDFKPGIYSVSTNSFPCEGWQVIEDRIFLFETEGVGVWKISKQYPVEILNQPIAEFGWQNDHYKATVGENGAVKIGRAELGYFLITEENGDAYSDESGDEQITILLTGPLVIEQKSVEHSIVRFDCGCQIGEANISATVRLIFDQTPLVRWKVDLDSRGTNFRIDMRFDTFHDGEIYAGMPFDLVKRPLTDTDLLPRQLDEQLKNVLLGQRELVEVKTFPFNDFVLISDGHSSSVVLAKGIHAYQVEEKGLLSLTLRRSVEWLTNPELMRRSGDAGPKMYVPDARCERSVRHEIAFMINDTNIDDISIYQNNLEFQNPPLCVVAGGEGKLTEWEFFLEKIPLSSLTIESNKILGRVFNPTEREYSLKTKYRGTDVWGNINADIMNVPPKTIQTIEIEQPPPEVIETQFDRVLESATLPQWRVGENKGLPDPEIISQIEFKIVQLEAEITLIQESMKDAPGYKKYITQYRYYVLLRELYELRLSVELNKRKLAQNGRTDYEYLYTIDPEILRLGEHLNDLRIKRRIYDYVVNALAS